MIYERHHSWACAVAIILHEHPLCAFCAVRLVGNTTFINEGLDLIAGVGDI